MKIEVVTKKHGPDKPTSYWARIKGDNQEIVWVTETYTAKASAYIAVDFLTREMMGLSATALVSSGGHNVLITEVEETEA